MNKNLPGTLFSTHARHVSVLWRIFFRITRIAYWMVVPEKKKSVFVYSNKWSKGHDTKSASCGYDFSLIRFFHMRF